MPLFLFRKTYLLEPQLNRNFQILGVTDFFWLFVAPKKKTSRRLSKSQFSRPDLLRGPFAGPVPADPSSFLFFWPSFFSSPPESAAASTAAGPPSREPHRTPKDDAGGSGQIVPEYPPGISSLEAAAVFRQGDNKEKRRREGGCGWPGKVPRSPAAHKKEKRKKADRKSLRHRTLTAPALQVMTLGRYQFQISANTLRRRLAEHDLRPRIPARGPQLTAAHRRVRLLFTQNHVDWELDQWSFSASSEERVQQHIGKFHFVEDDDNAYDTNLEQPEQEPAEDSDSGMESLQSLRVDFKAAIENVGETDKSLHPEEILKQSIEFEDTLCDVIASINDIVDKAKAIADAAAIAASTAGAGNYKEWLSFESSFKSIISENTSLNNLQKFQYLKSCLTEESKNSFSLGSIVPPRFVTSQKSGRAKGGTEEMEEVFFQFQVLSPTSRKNPVDLFLEKKFSFESSPWDIEDVFSPTAPGESDFMFARRNGCLVNRFRPYRRRQEGAADVKARRRRKLRRPTPPHREEEPSEGATLRDPPFPRARIRLPQPRPPNPPRNLCFLRPTVPGLRAERSSPTATAASRRPRAPSRDRVKKITAQSPEPIELQGGEST
ncbi:hypothetical protein GEV33_001497 [Tenebrio molitor]|uniref:Transposase Tc1-like domain-containing protein n=1 Tax=Tenebrio molitor TaxID=7067 RepID=A0A8J6HV38_TENMO|nr:hypothetical protein GEV33_001497 [Tenebrio molitor]